MVQVQSVCFAGAWEIHQRSYLAQADPKLCLWRPSPSRNAGALAGDAAAFLDFEDAEK